MPLESRAESELGIIGSPLMTLRPELSLQQSSHKVYPHLGILVGLPPKLNYFLIKIA